MKNIEIICTLGPSSTNERIIRRLSESGVSLFRINLSHIASDKIEETVRFIQKFTDVPVCIDTEGPQVRTGYIDNDRVFLSENSTVLLKKETILGTGKMLHLRPKEAYDALRVGDLITIDFDSVVLAVKNTSNDCIVTTVLNEGWIGSNKAVTVDRHIGMPVLSEKDTIGVSLLKKLGLKNISLSFVDCEEDILTVKKELDDDVRIIVKIETNEALKNLQGIIEVADVLLIDRGDLSREEPINKIPLLQREIIRQCNAADKKVIVATNLLESMVTTRKPLRSECNDIFNTLLSGADGLVLAAETAIGKYPTECVSMINRMIKYYDIAIKGCSFNELLKHDSLLLTEPHGGYLTDRYDPHPDLDALQRLPSLTVDRNVIIDAEQIGIGTYSPLTGFMTKNELRSVLDAYTLPSGVTWTLPITLQIDDYQYNKIKNTDTISLTLDEDNEIYATLSIKDIYSINKAQEALKWFGNNCAEHPGVKLLHSKGNYFIGGDITLVKRLPSPFKELEYTPKQTRLLFEQKNWSKIAGFHTQNAVHRAHEYLQQSVLQSQNLDGIFLHPVVGPKKRNDFSSSVIIDSYTIALNHYYPHGRFILGAFSAYSHYAGPRETVLTALCRKNFGCSHFITGRDHTGLKDYYSPTASIEIFNTIGDIGIKPIFFSTVHYCSKCDSYVKSCGHGENFYNYLSGTEVRSMLRNNQKPPDWYMRDKVSEMILAKKQRGEEVFV